MPGSLVLRWRLRSARHLRYCRLLVPRVESECDYKRLHRGLLWHVCWCVDGDLEPVLRGVHGRRWYILPCRVDRRRGHRMPGSLVLRWRLRSARHLRHCRLLVP